MRFRIDDIVRISKTSHYYEEDWRDDGGDHDSSNPCDKTEGIITDVIGDIEVLWDNGRMNTYYEDDLKLVRR